MKMKGPPMVVPLLRVFPKEILEERKWKPSVALNITEFKDATKSTQN